MAQRTHPLPGTFRAIGDASLADQSRSADLVADVTLAQAVTYTPGQLRVLRTSYVFRVNEVVSGNLPGEYATVNDTGGEYPDGSTVSTEHSRTSDNQPIRDRLPVAGNNQNKVGVLSNAQMTAGGFDSGMCWEPTVSATPGVTAAG
jgi:hypothetical protein